MMNLLNYRRKKAPNIRFWIDCAGWIDKEMICVVGWVYHPEVEVGTLLVRQDDNPVLDNGNLFFRGVRPDVDQHFGRTDSVDKWGFIHFVKNITGIDPEHKVQFNFSNGDESQWVEVDCNQLSSSVVAQMAKNFGVDELFTFLRECKPFKCFQDVYAIVSSVADSLNSVAKERIHIDRAIPAGDSGLFLTGWNTLNHGEKLEMHVVSSSDISVDVVHCMNYFERNDISEMMSEGEGHNKYGFFVYVPFSCLKDDSKFLFVVSKLNSTVEGFEFEVEKPQPAINEVSSVIDFLDISDPNWTKQMDHTFGPALHALWQGRLRPEKVKTFQFGVKNSNIEKSIVVPIYGRYDFVMYQVSQFVDDPDFKTAELIYVLDDPSIETEFLKECESVSNLFSFPIKVVSTGHNLGYAGANNVGVNNAKGELLFLLNSDVLPMKKGWASRMERVYKKQKKIGILGARLLFEDQTIQHNGMDYFKTNDVGNVWLIDHPGKGMPEWMVERSSQDYRLVPSVTGACMVMKKHLYQSLGGFDEGYIIGDFEDSDLCLKAKSKGLKIMVLESEKLYHLERLSQNLNGGGKDRKHKLTLYNAYRHNKLWDEVIERHA